VAYLVMIQKEKHASAARQFRVSNQVVSRLICGLRKNTSLLSELISKRAELQASRESIRRHLE